MANFAGNKRENPAVLAVERRLQMEHLVVENGIVKNGKQCQGEIRVPDGVTEIANQAFYQNKEITGLYLPDGVKTIGKYTVNCCEKLEYIRVPESVEKIGESGLVKRFESNCSFDHTIASKEIYPEIRCKEGSYVDKMIKELLEKKNKIASHSVTYEVKLVYEE